MTKVNWFTCVKMTDCACSDALLLRNNRASEHAQSVILRSVPTFPNEKKKRKKWR